MCIPAVFLVPHYVCDSEPSIVPKGNYLTPLHPHQHVSFTAQIELISCNNNWEKLCTGRKEVVLLRLKNHSNPKLSIFNFLLLK